ncbi:NADPH:quinone reductase-like Zn-dependent oxidoreductase [Arthrobacter sp. V1I7]|uniref:NADP-dependent oxidoreductase n=1 Tax=Arthrobacter sp. V1I7 TaxID=3042274 RepID=UPI00277F44A2|nr:NADP-dependent oxidoreductase [Arthrobacter sp. V1I7]MDQ0823743.1 NADPH:quinone reductase-like Zn-dependent oxidoreductase [Arthrobacter sp. V1I7]
MLTIQLDAPNDLNLRDLPTPVPGPGEVLIRFKASAINPADLKIRNGAIVPLSGDYPFILGWDLVGQVAGLGPETVGPAEGTRVLAMSNMAVTARGTWSEYVVLPASSITPAPEGIESAVLAQLPLVGLTALKAVEDLAPAAGDRILVVGAAGAVGWIVVQLLLNRGLQVHALVLSESQAEPLRTAGVSEVYVDDVPSNSFDRIVDAAGIDIAEALRPGGTYVSVVPGTEPGGDSMEGKTGTVVRIEESGERLAVLAGHVESGTLTLPAPTVFGLRDIHKAFESYETRAGGRTVLVL